MENIKLLEDFQKDDVYKLFLSDEFDVKAVTSSAVQLVAVTEHLSKLSTGITLLDKELHNQVANHYEDLLSQATGIKTLESVLQMVHEKIQSLMSSADRLKRSVADPYETVSRQTMMLIRLQMTCDLLRRIIRIMHLSHRLDIQLQGNMSDIIKAAQSIKELDYLMEGVDLNGLNIIAKNLQLIKRERERIHSQANVLLLKGIERQDHLDITTSLHVFHNLQILKPTVNLILKQMKDKIQRNIEDSLDMQRLSCQPQDSVQHVHGPGRAAIPLTGNTAAFRNNLWTNMENLMGNILNTFYCVQCLHEMLFKRRDLVSQVCFLDVLQMEEEFDFVQSLWEVVTTSLANKFSKAAKESPHIKQAFEVEFPKLLYMFNEFSRNLHEHGCHFFKGGESTSEQTQTDPINNSTKETLRNVLAPFENAYLARCLSRLTDSVNIVFGGDIQSAPTKHDLEGIIKAIKSELSAANSDLSLLNSVAKNVADTVNLFVEKCQYLVSTDAESTQVINPVSSNQVLNSKIVHLLHLLQQQISKISKEDSFPYEASMVIINSIHSIESLIRISFEPLLQSLSQATDVIIIKMHKEDFSMEIIEESITKAPEQPCSLYVKELQKFFVRSQSDYLSLYPDSDIVLKGIHDLAIHVIEMFVRHASLVRPLGDGGKMRLAADFAQIEMVVTAWSVKIGDLGRAYKLLRSFRPLLFQTSSHISQSTAICDIVPYSVLLQFLFSRAPPDLKTPYEYAGWSIEEYSHWLDDHLAEKERLILIKGSLEKYASWVKQRQGKEFCSIYPIMVDILQRGLQENS